MNTLEIFRVLRASPAVKQILLGVFPLDLLPPVTQYPAALVVNLDPSNEPGSHWVALFFDHTKHCDYFDSYGRKPYELVAFIKQNAESYTYNNIQVQGFFAVSCGHMCIYFLVWRAMGIPFKNIVQSMQSENIYKYFETVKAYKNY